MNCLSENELERNQSKRLDADRKRPRRGGVSFECGAYAVRVWMQMMSETIALGALGRNVPDSIYVQTLLDLSNTASEYRKENPDASDDDPHFQAIWTAIHVVTELRERTDIDRLKSLLTKLGPEAVETALEELRQEQARSQS